MTAPTQTTPSIGRRLASMLYESLLLLGVLSVGFIVPHVALGMVFQVVLPGIVLWTNLLLVLATYFLWYWMHGGQTLAMQTWKIRIAAPDGGAPPHWRLALRFLLMGPLMLSGVGILWALIDREGQFLQDRLAGTRILLK